MNTNNISLAILLIVVILTVLLAFIHREMFIDLFRKDEHSSKKIN